MFVVDQTPTPTKFLKSCEEVGLFQEINPFDKDFKKAVEQQQSDVCLKFIARMFEVYCNAAGCIFHVHYVNNCEFMMTTTKCLSSSYLTVTFLASLIVCYMHIVLQCSTGWAKKTGPFLKVRNSCI